METLAQGALRLNLDAIDYVILGLYFATVLGIGFAARRAISHQRRLLPVRSGRSPPG